MTETLVERQQHDHRIVQELLDERVELWTLYGSLGHLRPFAPGQPLESKLREFCQVLVDMVLEDLIFQDQNTDSLFEPGGFKSKYVSKIEADPVGDYSKCRKVLSELGLYDASGIKFECTVPTL